MKLQVLKFEKKYSFCLQTISACTAKAIVFKGPLKTLCPSLFCYIADIFMPISGSSFISVIFSHTYPFPV